MARIAVVGAGVVGVASACLLCRQGHDVTLIDSNSGPAEGASRANGAQLSYGYGDALASPSLVRHMPGILLRQDPAYRIRLQADPEFLLWGLRFLLNGTPGRFRANTRFLLEMAAATHRLLADLLADADLAFDYDVSGKMLLYPTAAAVAGTTETRRLKQEMGIGQAVLDRAEATALEPALGLYPDEIGGVIYSADDAAGRPDLFSAALIRHIHGRYALKTMFGHEVTGVASHRGRVTGVMFAAREPLECDIVVAASGYTTAFLPGRDRLFGAIWPIQGYSITAPATVAAMRVSITDVRRKIVFARLGSSVRAAGLADIGPRQFCFDSERFGSFRSACVTAFGATFEHQGNGTLAAWSGGRPCTPSSRPIIRPGSLKGLYLNIGHGTLGWTLCLGSAERLASLVRENC